MPPSAWITISLMSFVGGLLFGSFFGVLADRLPQGKSPFVGRSRCGSCGHELRAPDLVPVLSYLALGRRCRYCGTRLSPFYPAIELTTGVAFVAAFFTATTLFGWSIAGLAAFVGLAALASALIVIVFARFRPQ
jgi:leader peptidase (prepilin peptidase) / N-methyltransferase